MTNKQIDLMGLVRDHYEFKDKKNETLILLVRGCIDVQQYNKDLTIIEQNMNASQFRYINKYKVIDNALSKKEFVLSPEDLEKFNYN